MEIPERTNNFDQLRLLGAILVIYGHSYALLGLPVPQFAANAVSTVGVKIFFCISGYLVARSWMRDPHLGRFLARRSLRIFPALIVIVLLTAFVAGPLLTRLSLGDYFSHPATYSYLNTMGLYITYFLPGLFETNIYPNAVNGSLWSLPVEFAMYLVLPALIGLGGVLHRRWGLTVLAAVFVVVALLLATKARPQGQWVVYATDVLFIPVLGAYFVVSALCAVHRMEQKLNLYAALAGLLALALFDFGPFLKEGLLIFVLPYVTLCYGLGRAPYGRFLRGRDLSYGLFLYGFLIQQALIQFFGANLNPWTLFGAATLIAGGFAWLSWHLVEAPALACKPSVSSRLEVARVSGEAPS